MGFTTEAVIAVKAFGVNHAETHMREGKWPEATEISGIECAGLVKADPDGRLVPGQKVVASWGHGAQHQRQLC
jgi:NADPH2:quinone reductase